MDLWRWAPVPSDLPISAGSSTSVNALSDRQQLAVTSSKSFEPCTKDSLSFIIFAITLHQNRVVLVVKLIFDFLKVLTLCFQQLDALLYKSSFLVDSYMNKTETPKVGAISKAQKAQSF